MELNKVFGAGEVRCSRRGNSLCLQVFRGQVEMFGDFISKHDYVSAIKDKW